MKNISVNWLVELSSSKGNVSKSIRPIKLKISVIALTVSTISALMTFDSNLN